MKKHYIFLAAYMIVMGLGLFVCKNFLNTPYDGVHFSRRFLPFMALLAVMVVIYSVRFQSLLSLERRNKNTYIFSILPLITIVSAAILAALHYFSWQIASIIPFIDATLIGIAEEGMFRYIILGALLHYIKPVKAILLSSLLFGALHLLNILGGLSIDEVGSQLISTIAMGIFLGTVYAYTSNIYIPILFHSAWDYIFLVQGIEVPYVSQLFIITIVLEIIVTCIMLWRIKRRDHMYS